MMTRAELGRAAAKMGLGLGQAEHEYALLCLLDGLSQTPSLSETLCLKGGTALRQIYYADWRHSVDLDFSTLPPFDPEGLQYGLDEWFACFTVWMLRFYPSTSRTGQLGSGHVSLDRSIIQAVCSSISRSTSPYCFFPFAQAHRFAFLC